MSQLPELKAENSLLGKEIEYGMHYHPDLLFAISRQKQRDEIGVPAQSPFYGFDLWNHYEVSWLNQKGKPIVALAEITYDCNTPCIIESKSMKLYFNSLNNTSFKDVESVKTLVTKDIATRIGGEVFVNIIPLANVVKIPSQIHFDGICLDELDIECSTYTVDSATLKTENEFVEELVYSNLLKSNCLVTHQPDWASVQIAYKGQKINHTGLLRYIVSFRNHNEFHEQCIERIFMDIMRHCQPNELTVYGRYTRRGGLDINPYRSTIKSNQTIQNNKFCRQ